MPLLRFKAEDVRRVVEHSINAPQQGEQTVSYEPHTTRPVAAPSVALVRDSGVYLMSNGKPRDKINDTASFVAYADGCNPDKDEDWYDTAHDLVGGDDFFKLLPWAHELKAKLDRGTKTIMIRMNQDSIEIV